MREELPLVSYERGMNHNYLVLSKCDFFGANKDGNRSYRVRMLLENKIQGLLPVTQRQVNGESKYYYEINSLQSLDRLIEKKELKHHELRAILLGCINLFDRLEEYLLNGEQIIIKPDFIYVNVESMEPNFVCYPDYTGDVRLSFMEFIDELLTHIDHKDEQAVMLGYQVYRYTRNPNYVLTEIHRFVECTISDIPKDTNYCGRESGEFRFVPESNVMEMGSRHQEKKALDNKTLDEGREISTVEAYEGHNRDHNDHDRSSKKGDIKELIGGIFCVFVALCAGAVIVGARVLKSFTLSGDNELYMYGAVAMALVAAVLFFVCYVKSVKQNREIEELNEGYEENVYEELISKDIVNNLTIETRACEVKDVEKTSLTYSSETVCLGEEVIEERILRGKVNGNEVNVPLDCLPLTVGKLGSVSDFIINDNAVSKLHARFEEHNGRVCVCDLNSTNGTVRNGEVIEINTPVALEPGDKLRFGRSCFTYC